MSKTMYATDCRKEFCNLFDLLCRSRSRYSAWSDLVHLIAYSISNAIDPIHKDRREEEYKRIASGYDRSDLDTISKLFAIIIKALEQDPDQDFLGSLYMQLGLGNQHAGQFFTPYHVSAMMAEINAGQAKQQLEGQEYISVVDPCVGGGAMLIAFANVCKKNGIDYQNKVLFVGQDIDHTAGLMAYIQLSLLGCAGYIVIDNSLTDPLIGDPIFAPIHRETYITPTYAFPVWMLRRMTAQMASDDNDKQEGELQQ